MSSRIHHIGLVAAAAIVLIINFGPSTVRAASVVLPAALTNSFDMNFTTADGHTVQHLDTYLNEFVADYKRVRGRQSKTRMKHISTAGLLAGVVRVDDLLRSDLRNKTQSFLQRFDAASVDEVLEHLVQLEQQVARDRMAIEFLCGALDVARNVQSFDEFKEKADEDLVANEIALIEFAKKRHAMRTGKAMLLDNGNAAGNATAAEIAMKAALKRKLSDMMATIEQHLQYIHAKVKRSAKETIQFVEKDIAANRDNYESVSFEAIGNEAAHHESVFTNQLSHMSKLLSGILRRQDKALDAAAAGLDTVSNEIRPKGDVDKIKEIGDNEIVPAKQELDDGDSESASMEAGPGGLVGLIASLSGGEEGSDIGALIGALTGVITNIFGPNGLDIEMLLGTGTSLIAGLLGGDENFGKVLGGYVGTALDGLSGGGGAINQGQFFGQFLGTVIAFLSADPEDDDLPLKPKLFIQNVFSGSKMATSKAGAEEAETTPKPNGGSDFFGFIGNIVGSIVAGVTSLIVNSSVGSSGGASQGSADLIGGSSAASSAGSNTKPHHHHPDGAE